MLRTLLTLWTALVTFVVLLFTVTAQATLIALRRVDRQRMAAGYLLRRAAVVVTWFNPLWRFAVSGPVPPAPGRAVVICNHCSNADVFLISHLPWEMKWMAKASLFKVQPLGWAMTLAGDVPVRRGDPGSARRALRRCAAYLKAGVPVMLFPEGTRSKTEEMRPFKDGAFKLAVEAGCPILPLALVGTRQALPKHDWRMGWSTGRVMVGEPIDCSELTSGDIPALKAEVRAQIEEMRGRLRAALSPAE